MSAKDIKRQDHIWGKELCCNFMLILLIQVNLPSSLKYKTHQIPTLKIFSYCIAAFVAESLEARCQVENEDVVGAAPTGDAPTTSE